MAEFLTTTGTSHAIEELIKGAREYLIIISPYIQLNKRIKDLLVDKGREEIDIQLVYGKGKLKPNQIDWLSTQEFITINYRQDLHAKCYLNEQRGIITSMNLYEFSQINNDEMSVGFDSINDTNLFDDATEEAKRIIRVSEQQELIQERESPGKENQPQMLSTSKVAKKLGITNKQLKKKLLKAGLLEEIDGKEVLTGKAIKAGAETKAHMGTVYQSWPVKIFKL